MTKPRSQSPVPKTIIRFVVALVAAASMAVLWAGPSSASAPPWEPDPNSATPYGNIVFYNSSGSVISGGSDLSHIADYAVATSAKDTGATQANLIFAAPDHTKITSLWSTDAASASTPFPNGSAPAPVNGFAQPVVTLGPTDADISAFLGGIVKDSTAGYANIYQVRLKDSGPNGAGSGTHYWSTDIMVDENAGTWTQVYPQVQATATAIALSATPAGFQYSGDTVTLSGVVTPAVAGQVQFKDDGGPLGGPVAVDVSGHASMDTTALTVGTHALSAEFAPTDTTNYAGSTSAPVTYWIAGAPAWIPLLSGSHRIGGVESCLAAFDHTTSVTYAWYYNGYAVGGATASTYKVPEAYYGTKLSCAVTASNPAGTTGPTMSAPFTMGVGPALVPTAKPYLYHGTNKTTATHGSYEYVKPGTWSPAATSYTYQWYVGSSRISGATSYRFKPPTAYKGKYIYCLLTAKRLRWTNGSYKTRGVKVV